MTLSYNESLIGLSAIVSPKITGPILSFCLPNIAGLISSSVAAKKS